MLSVDVAADDDFLSLKPQGGAVIHIAEAQNITAQRAPGQFSRLAGDECLA